MSIFDWLFRWMGGWFFAHATDTGGVMDTTEGTNGHEPTATITSRWRRDEKMDWQKTVTKRELTEFARCHRPDWLVDEGGDPKKAFSYQRVRYPRAASPPT
jgi:hypothetical protein